MILSFFEFMILIKWDTLSLLLFEYFVDFIMKVVLSFIIPLLEALIL